MLSVSAVLFLLACMCNQAFADEKIIPFSCNTPGCVIDQTYENWTGGTVLVRVRGDFGNIGENAHIRLNGQTLGWCSGILIGACEEEYFECGPYDIDAMDEAVLHVDSTSESDGCAVHMKGETVWTTVEPQRMTERTTFYDSCNSPGCSIDREVQAWPGGEVSVQIRGDFSSLDETATILVNGLRLGICQGDGDCDADYYFCGTWFIDQMDSAIIHVDSSDEVNICNPHMEVETIWTPDGWIEPTPCNGDNNEVSMFTDNCTGAHCHVEQSMSQWPGGFVNVQIRGDFNHMSKTAYIVINGITKDICSGGNLCGDVYFDCGEIYVPAMMELTVQVQRSDSDLDNPSCTSTHPLEAEITFIPSTPHEFGFEEHCNTRSCFVEHTICNWPGGEVNVNIRGDFGHLRETATILYYGTDVDGQEVNIHGNTLDTCQGGPDCSNNYYDCGKFPLPPMQRLVLHIDSSDKVDHCTKHMEVQSLFTSAGDPMSEENVLHRSRFRPVLGQFTNVNMLEAALPEATFNSILTERDPRYSYDALLTAAAAFPDFCGGTLKQCKIELAFVFGHFTQETGNAEDWFSTFFRAEEQDPPADYVSTECTTCGIYAPHDGVTYIGRGAKQLSWNYNYGVYSQIFFDDKDILLAHPERLLEEDHIIKSALWFYMTPQSPKPSMHDIVLGHWKPEGQRLNMNERFAWTNHVINGAVECNSTAPIDARSVSRYGFFERWAEHFGWKSDFSSDEWGMVDCRPLGNYGSQVSTLKLFWRQDDVFTNTCGCEFTTTVTAFPRYLRDPSNIAVDGLDWCEMHHCGLTGGSENCRTGVTEEDSCENLYGGSTRCGVDWGDANLKCGHRCGDNQHCLIEGEACQGGLEQFNECTGSLQRRLLAWYNSQ